MPVEDLVEVGRHDLFLAGLTGELRGQSRRLDDLLRLANVAVGSGRRRAVREEPGADELLRDRGSAAFALAVGMLSCGRQDGRRVVTAVIPERSVFGRGGC